MVEEEAASSKAELNSSLPSPPPPPSASSSLPSSPSAPLLKIDPPEALLSSTTSSSHLFDLPLLPDPLLRDQGHVSRSDPDEGGEALISDLTREQEQQHQTKNPFDASYLLPQQEIQADPSLPNSTVDGPEGAAPLPDGPLADKTGDENTEVERQPPSQQSLDVQLEVEVDSGGSEEGGKEEGEVEGMEKEREPASLVHSSTSLGIPGEDGQGFTSSQLPQDSASQSPSPSSPKATGQHESGPSRYLNDSVSNHLEPFPWSLTNSISDLRASSASPDLPAKKNIYDLPLPRPFSSLPMVYEPNAAGASVEDSVEDASSMRDENEEEQGSQGSQEDQSASQLPSVEEEDAYIDATSSQGGLLEVKPTEQFDEHPEENRDVEEDEEDPEDEEDEDEQHEEMEVDEVSRSAGSSQASTGSRPIGGFTKNRADSSSSCKRKDLPPPSPTSSSRQAAAPPVVKRPKQPFRSPMIHSSPGRPSPSLLPSTASANDRLRPSASSPPPSPPPSPPASAPPKPKRPRSTFKALTVSLPPPPPPPAPRKTSSSFSSTDASKATAPPPPKRKKPVVPFHSPLGPRGPGVGTVGGGGAGFSQAKEIAEMDRKVQMLKQALRFVGTSEGRRKEERDSDLVEKWKVAGREISQLLWDETPSCQDPSKDSNSGSISSSSFSFNDQPFGFSSSSSSSTQPSPFLSSFQPQSFETSFGFSSSASSIDFPSRSHSYTLYEEDSTLLEPDSDSSLPSPKSVSRQIDQTLAKRANGGRVGLGVSVRAFLEERRERVGSRAIVEEDEEDEEEDAEDEGGGDGGEEDNGGGGEREEKRKRKRRAEAWNVGEMLRKRFGVDPVLFGWDDECEDWL